MDPAPGVLPLDGYRNLTLIGRGGYSEVHRAWQERFDRWVALKVLTFAMLDDAARERFRRECQATGRLSGHPNVVIVHDADITPDGRPYLAMQLYESGSALDRLVTTGPLPVDEVLRWGIQVAGALETAHRAGILHRDVKPGNILLTAFGQPALSDFGLSVVAEHQGISLGIDAHTPNHAAPEVLERGETSVASDVFALTSTLYTLLAGRAPHPPGGSEGAAEVRDRVQPGPMPPLGRSDLPRGVEAVLEQGLADDPSERPASAEALGELLQAVERELGDDSTAMTLLDGPQAPPGPPPSPPPGEPTLPPRTVTPSASPVHKSRRAPVGRAILALVLLVVLVLLGARLLDDDEPSTTPTTTPAAYVPEEVPTEVGVSTTEEGLMVAWDGPHDAEYLVLVLSEDTDPRTMPPTRGTQAILDPDDIDPTAGHCVTVAFADELVRAPADQLSDAFSAPVCVNGAGPDSVRME